MTRPFEATALFLGQQLAKACAGTRESTGVNAMRFYPVLGQCRILRRNSGWHAWWQARYGSHQFGELVQGFAEADGKPVGLFGLFVPYAQ